MPVELISGDEAVRSNAAKFALGKKAVIVTGRSSAKKSGALDDVTAVLAELGVEWVVYDRIMENPLVSVCYEGGCFARENGADFVIGIGGGSPLDAAKVIAAYAADPELDAMDIYSAKLTKVLPIIAIPTTSGTGSEANPVSVMTIDGKNVKKSVKSPLSFPKYAFLDPKYTASLNNKYTVSTALDAFCHCAESYLSPKSSEVSRMFALHGAKKLYDTLAKIEALGENASLEALKPFRYDLMTGACAGGVAINTTGTGFNHPLGYNLTLYHGVPHGSACGAFMGEYFAYNLKTAEGEKLIGELCAWLGQTPEKVAADIVKWSNVSYRFDDKTIEQYIENVKGAGNYKNSPYVINVDEMRAIYKKLFQ